MSSIPVMWKVLTQKRKRTTCKKIRVLGVTRFISLAAIFYDLLSHILIFVYKNKPTFLNFDRPFKIFCFLSFSHGLIEPLLKMSMLSEPRRRQKWSLNPRGTLWSKDESKVGQKMLEKFGWKAGEGLGKESQGMKDPIGVNANYDNKGTHLFIYKP